MRRSRQRLYSAIAKADISQIKALLADGIDPNSISESGMSAALNAALWHRADILKILVDAGADLDVPINDKEETALIFTANVGNIKAAKLLLEAGADPDITDNKDNTALHRAIENNFVNTVRVLLSHGADPEIENELGDTAAKIAKDTFDRYQEILKLLDDPSLSCPDCSSE